MMDKKIQEALNNQINYELFSAYLYLSMSAYFENGGLSGCASWMNSQAQEEMVHALKMYNYIVECGGRVKLAAIGEPRFEWDSPVDVLKETLEHERGVTRRIYKIVDLAIELKDHGTNQFLQWFVGEQVEEEATAEDILKKMELMKDAPGGMYLLDQEMGARPALFTLPVAGG
ncbi:ferritin [bacterium]|nr:ferritin [bacterium]MBU1025985.1 ferritin [bacterium]